MNKLSVIIPTYNGLHWLEQCIPSLEKQQMQDFELILVDNGSTDGTREWAQDHTRIDHYIYLEENRGFAAAVNIGVGQSNTPLVFLLNNDTLVKADCLVNVFNYLNEQGPEVAAVQCLMLQLENPNIIDDAGDQLSWFGRATKSRRGQALPQDLPEDIFSPSGGASLYRKSIYEALGGMDEAFFAYLEDVDLGLRMRLAGYQVKLCRDAIVYHKSHGSMNDFQQYIHWLVRNKLMLMYKNLPWSNLIYNYPYFVSGRFYTFLEHGKISTSFRAYIDYLRLLPQTLKKRKDVEIKLTFSEINELLHRRAASRPIGDLLSGYWRALRNKLSGK